MGKATKPSVTVHFEHTDSATDFGLHLPSTGELKGKWKTYVGEAKVVWGKLTDNELLQTEGHLQKLAGLVQQRYAITMEAAERQVRDFLNKHM